jgi:hypothetical protein
MAEKKKNKLNSGKIIKQQGTHKKRWNKEEK